MGKVFLEYSGMITITLGLQKETIEFTTETITMGGLIELLIERHGKVIDKYIKQGYQILVTKNDSTKKMINANECNIALNDGDKVLFLYMFAGG